MTTGAARVLVLGASGQLGTILRHGWPAGDAIWHSRHPDRGEVCFDPLGDPEAMRAAAHRTRAILCLSGVTNAGAARTGAPMRANIDLALAAIRAAAAAGVPQIFLASSAAVYGRAGGVLREDMDCSPVSDYGRAKLAMETQGLALGSDLGVAVTCLRIGNVAGADAILGGWREGFALDRLNDGSTPRRSYIGPLTLTRVLHQLSLGAALPDRINVAQPGIVSMGHLLDAAGLAWQPRAAGPDVIAEVALATRRLAQHIEPEPDSSTAEGLVAEWATVKELGAGPT